MLWKHREKGNIWKMCELFAVSAGRKVKVNSMLGEFFSHSVEHRNGWGIAIFDGLNVSVEREPIQASKSQYLKNRLTARFEVENMMAHIRKATIGAVEFNNSHPFIKKDESGRTWTLIHNGTIFESPVLSPYQYKQEGSTDSERILLYLVDQVNRRFMDDLNLFDVNERMKLVDQVIRRLAPENKLNLIIYDGEYMYIHKNAPGTLYIKEEVNRAVVSTVPLDKSDWSEVPDNQLLVYKSGNLVYTGIKHSFTYKDDPEKLKSLYLGYSEL